MAIDTEQLKKMLKDPADHFTSPSEVLTHSELSHEQKQSVLESWKVDEQELAKATEENMGRSDSNLLAEVVAALKELDQD
jgi:DNA-directed RNA polymerase subunit H (RpoH/RPB5)